MNKQEIDRINNLLPNGMPKWVRIYDNGATTVDRYTVVFTGNYNGVGLKRGERSNMIHPYIGMSAAPYHPQGFCQHGESTLRCIDVNGWGFAPMMGKKNHLGKRISFGELNHDCQRVILNDYIALWQLKGVKITQEASISILIEI